MTPGTAAGPPDAPCPDPTPAPPPTAADVLRWCAAAAPGLWFPSAHVGATGVPRASLDDPLWLLRQAGLVRVGDWVRGRGQGFALTPAGQQVLADPARLTDIRPVPPGEPDPPADDSDATPAPDPIPASPPIRPVTKTGATALERGDAARAALLTPPPAVVSPILLVLNVVWFGVGLVAAHQAGGSLEQYARGKDSEVLVRLGAAFGPRIVDGEWWRLVSNGFVHFGLPHLLLNMLGLLTLGPIAEGLWGRWRFAAIYLLSGVAGAAAAVALNPTAAIAGASGSIWGLMLAVVAWLLRYREHLPPALLSGAVRRMALAVGVNAAVGLIPGVSWEAHLAGGVAGCAAAVLFDLTRRRAGWVSVAVGAVGVVGLVGLTLGGLAAAVEYGAAWQPVRERHARFHEQVRAALGPGRLRAVDATVTLALTVRGPETTAHARQSVEQLRADAELVAKQAPKRARAYPAEVERFAALLAERLAADRRPTHAEWEAVAAQRAKVDEAWAAAEGK